LITGWRFERVAVPRVRFLARQVFVAAPADGVTTLRMPATRPNIARTD
jgi:hypothetical protein